MIYTYNEQTNSRRSNIFARNGRKDDWRKKKRTWKDNWRIRQKDWKDWHNPSNSCRSFAGVGYGLTLTFTYFEIINGKTNRNYAKAIRQNKW